MFPPRSLFITPRTIKKEISVRRRSSVGGAALQGVETLPAGLKIVVLHDDGSNITFRPFSEKGSTSTSPHYFVVSKDEFIKATEVLPDRP